MFNSYLTIAVVRYDPAVLYKRTQLHGI